MTRVLTFALGLTLLSAGSPFAALAQSEGPR